MAHKLHKWTGACAGGAVECEACGARRFGIVVRGYCAGFPREFWMVGWDQKPYALSTREERNAVRAMNKAHRRKFPTRAQAEHYAATFPPDNRPTVREAIALDLGAL